MERATSKRIDPKDLDRLTGNPCCDDFRSCASYRTSSESSRPLNPSGSGDVRVRGRFVVWSGPPFTPERSRSIEERRDDSRFART
jgi:hypothetical protein